MNSEQLYDWQEKALNDPNNSYALWVCEAGTGKTHAAALWLQQKDRSRNAVVLGPKQIRGDWEARAPKASYFTPQTILKESLPKDPSAIVVDEADMWASPLFLATKRSQCTTKLYDYIKRNPETPVLLLTATPIRSTPWNLHTLLTYIGRYIDWKEYRQKFFTLEHKPFIPRPAWFPAIGWQRDIQPLLEKNSVFALMVDIIPPDKVPVEVEEIIKLKAPDYEKNVEWEASKQFAEDHRLEQHKKHNTIKSIARGYRKVVVVAHFRDQIDELRKELSKERSVYVLDGRTTNPSEVINAAKADGECYFIIQAAVGAGFNIPEFPVMIFASQGYSTRNYVQMKGRIKRGDDLIKSKGRKKLMYYFLQGGKCDRMVYNSIQMGKDFVPSEYMR